MVNSATLKAGCLVFMLLMLAMSAVWCYLLIYLAAKGRKHTKGRTLAIEIQIEVLVALCVILSVYLLSPLIEPGEPAYRNGFYLVMGADLLELGGFIYASIKFTNPIRHKYSDLVNYAYWFGGGAMFISGAAWILGCERPLILEIVLVSIAVGVLLGTESWFLSRNRWRFLPRHPE